jgi:hypothetical protein
VASGASTPGAMKPVRYQRDGSSPSPDGRSIVTAFSDGMARIWRVSPNTQDLINVAKDRLTRLNRCLTPTQRRAYFLPEAPPLWCVERRLWPYHGDDWQAWLAARQSDPNAPLPKAE